MSPIIKERRHIGGKLAIYTLNHPVATLISIPVVLAIHGTYVIT